MKIKDMLKKMGMFLLAKSEEVDTKQIVYVVEDNNGREFVYTKEQIVQMYNEKMKAKE